MLVKLTDVCQFQGGNQPPKSEWADNQLDDYVRMLQIRDFTQAKEKYIQYVKNNNKLKKCNKTDILIGRYGASIGKILTGLEGAYNVALMKITPNEKLDRNYLYQYLNSHIFQNFILAIGTRAAQAGFNKEDLSKIKIPLPPLEQQKAIAKKLDKAKELIELRKASIEKLDELSKAIFVDMFGDPVENEMGWEVDKLENFGDWRGGGTPSRKEPKYFEGNIPWITTVSLDKLFIDISKSAEFITEEAIEKSATKIIPKNSVIIGTRVGVGKVAINKDELCTNQDIISLTNIKDSINNIYVYYSIKQINRFLKEEQRGATIQGITSKFLKNISLPIPPIDLQNKFAKTIQKIEAQKALYEEALEKLEYNFEALLGRVFSPENTDKTKCE